MIKGTHTRISLYYQIFNFDNVRFRICRLNFGGVKENGMSATIDTSSDYTPKCEFKLYLSDYSEVYLEPKYTWAIPELRYIIPFYNAKKSIDSATFRQEMQDMLVEYLSDIKDGHILQ